MIDITQLMIVRKIHKGEKKLIELGLGQEGEMVSFYYAEQEKYHKTTKKPLKSVPVPTNTDDYWPDFYINDLDQVHAEITGFVPDDSEDELVVIDSLDPDEVGRV
jgi:hypothetical protein